MESAEKDTPREYNTLDDDEKVNAISGAVFEPVSKQFAIELSGINYDGMEDEQRAKVELVFAQAGIEAAEDNGVTKYRLGDKEREKLDMDVDMKTVHGAIADKILGKFGLDDNLKK